MSTETNMQAAYDAIFTSPQASRGAPINMQAYRSLDNSEGYAFLNQYQQDCMRTWGAPEEDSLVAAALGICGESVEVVQAAYTHEPELHNLGETLAAELGDVAYYVAAAAKAMGRTLSQVFEDWTIEMNVPSIEDESVNLLLAGGYFAEMTKKHTFHHKDVWGNLYGALFVTFFRWLQVCSVHQLDPKEVLAANITKLRLRYPDGFPAA